MIFTGTKEIPETNLRDINQIQASTDLQPLGTLHFSVGPLNELFVFGQQLVERLHLLTAELLVLLLLEGLLLALQGQIRHLSAQTGDNDVRNSKTKDGCLKKVRVFCEVPSSDECSDTT